MSMSWNRQAPPQRYSAVPGFEAQQPQQPMQFSSSPATANTPITDDDRSGYELDNVPPAHRASLYSDPFHNNGSQASDNTDSPFMNPGSNFGRPSHNQNQPMSGAGAGYGAGYGQQGGGFNGYNNGGYSNGGGYNNGGASYSPNGGSAMYGSSTPTGNMTADELWEMERGKERVPVHDEEADSGGKRNKKPWIIAAVCLIIAAIIAVVVGVVVTQTRKNGDSSGKSGSNGNKTNGAVLKDPNDPSNFDKDERLHNVFWAMAYQPDGAIPPECGATQAEVNRDMQILSQLTTRLRLYGANCNMTALVLQAIQDTKVDMTIYPAIYIDSNTEAYTTQVEAVLDAFKTYGVDHVEGLAVGNEYLLNQGNSAPSGSKYLSDVKKLTGYVSEVRTKVQALGLSKTIPVGTGDAGSLMSPTLGEGVDFYMANVHPWFGQVPIEQAAGWTWDYFTENDVAPAMKASNQPPTYIAETGWPTKYTAPQGGDTGQDSGNPPSDATDANLQIFLDTFVCQANKNETHYFFFEPFDQEWKEKLYGGVEPYWGLFDKDRVLKNITIPTC